MRGLVACLLVLGLGHALPVAAPAAETPPPAAPQPAAGPPTGGKVDEFGGFEKASFGMPYAEVKKLYPQAEDMPQGKDLGAATVGGPYVRRLLFTDQAFVGLSKPVTVELRFWKNRLWGMIVYTRDVDQDQVFEMLTKRLGPSDSKDPNYPLWERSKTATTMERKQKYFAVNDVQLSKEAQEWFGKVLRGEWKGPTQAELVELGLATPAPTPAAAAAATPARH